MEAETAMETYSYQNKPILNNVKTNFTALTPGRQEILEQIELELKQGWLTLIGLPGMGKSTIVSKFAISQQNKGISVLWFNADSYHTLKGSFLKLASDKLGISRSKEKEGQSKYVKSIADAVYDFYSKSLTLFVFDNVVDYDEIQQFLPLEFPEKGETPNVLIISPDLNWKRPNVLERELILGEFERTEAIAFVKNFLKIKDDVHDESITYLVEKLKYFPLALHLASHCIKECRIREYLEEYEKIIDDVSATKVFKQLISVCDQATFIVLRISLDRIKHNAIGSKQAINIFNIIAYLSTEDIPISLFMKIESCSSHELEESIELLKQYSLVRQEHSLNTHKLLQKLRRQQLKDEQVEGINLEEKTLEMTLNLVQKVLENSRDINDYTQHIISVWSYACKYDNLINKFLVNFEKSGQYFTTFLHLIVEYSSHDVLRNILERIEEISSSSNIAQKNIVNVVNQNGETPLHNAIQNGKADVVTMLLQKNANVNITNKNGWTSLHLAAQNGSPDVVKTLLKTKLNFEAKILNDSTPLHVAVLNDNIEVVRVLVEKKGLNVNASMSDGSTSLHLAAQRGNLELFKVLLDHGANIDARNETEESAADVATDSEIISFINERKLSSFDKRPGTGGVQGQFYERDLAMMLFLQGTAKTRNKEIDKFCLATNMNKLGDFDDVAFKYSYKDSGGLDHVKLIFIQAKHKDNPEHENSKISLQRLLSEPEKKDAFTLRDYFASYLKVKKHFSEANVNHPIFGCSFKDCEFIIYTNAHLPYNICKRNENLERKELDQNHVLNFGTNKCFYKLAIRKNTEVDNTILQTLQYASDQKRLAKELANSIFPDKKDKKKEKLPEISNQGIIKTYQYVLSKKVIEKQQGKGVININFLNDESLCPEDEMFRDTFLNELRKKTGYALKSVNELKEALEKITIILSKDFGNCKENEINDSLPNDVISNEEIEEFLDKLKLLVSQPNNTELGNIIRDAIEKEYKVTAKEDIETIFSKVNKRIENWWKEDKMSLYLTEECDYFKEEKSYLNKLKRPAKVTLPKKWQLPPQNHNFVGRKRLLESIDEKLKCGNILAIIACHGLGGVGKTQLALEFIWKNHQHFKEVLWFDAKDKNSLINEYIKLGCDRNIIDNDEVNAGEEQCALRVKQWLEAPERSGWLMVCDNVPNYETIAGLLPVEGGNIVLTSRYGYAWPQSQNSIRVDVFSLDEAREYVFKVLHEQELVDVDNLATTLGFLPLALAQACAYIFKTSVSITKYLKLYDRRKQALLSSKVLLETFPAGSNKDTAAGSNKDTAAGSNKDKAAIVYVTWDITIEAIERESMLAANWFALCAYLDSSPIPCSLMEAFSEDPKNNPDDEIVEEALGIIQSYSMLIINNEAKSMTVHNLVQEVTRLKLEEIGKTKSVLKNTLDLMKNDILNPKCAVDHAVAAWHHGSKLEELVRIFRELPGSIIMKLIDFIRYNEARAFGEEALKHLKNSVGESDYSTLVTKNYVGLVLYHQGNYKEVLQIYFEVFENLPKPESGVNLDIITVMSNIASVYQEMGEYDKSLEKYQEVYDLGLKLLGENELHTLLAKHFIAEVLILKGEFKEALPFLEYVYPRFSKKMGIEHSHALALQNHMVVALQNLTQFDRALEKHQQELKAGVNLSRENHPVSLETLNKIGIISFKQGRYDDALDIFKKVYAKKSKDLGDNHPDFISAEHNMALLLDYLENSKDAQITHESFLSKMIKVLRPDYLKTLNSKQRMADLLYLQGKYSDALKILREILNLQNNNTNLGPEHVSTVKTEQKIGFVLNAQGEYDEALKILQGVLRKRLVIFGPDNTDTLTTRNYIAYALYHLGRKKESLDLCQEIYADSIKLLGSGHPNTQGVKYTIVQIKKKMSNDSLQTNIFGRFWKYLNRK